MADRDDPVVRAEDLTERNQNVVAFVLTRLRGARQTDEFLVGLREAIRTAFRLAGEVPSPAVLESLVRTYHAMHQRDGAEIAMATAWLIQQSDDVPPPDPKAKA